MSTLRSGAGATVVALMMAAALTSCTGNDSTPVTTTSTSTTLAPPTTSTTIEPPTTIPPSTTTTSTTSTTTTTTSTTSTTTTTTSTTVPSDAVPPLPAGLGGQEWNTVPTSARVVALTFDAGANDAGLASILRTLQLDHVKATFFLTGDFVEQFKGQARAIVAAGMRVGDHSVTHPYFTKLTDDQIHQQVLDSRERIRAVTGLDPWPWFRFPFFDRDDRTIAAVNAVGFVPIGWTVDTLGWEGKVEGISVQSIVARVLEFLRPGAIVVMHCGSNPYDQSTLDADALPKVIAALRDPGYSFVTLDAFTS